MRASSLPPSWESLYVDYIPRQRGTRVGGCALEQSSAVYCWAGRTEAFKTMTPVLRQSCRPPCWGWKRAGQYSWVEMVFERLRASSWPTPPPRHHLGSQARSTTRPRPRPPCRRRNRRPRPHWTVFMVQAVALVLPPSAWGENSARWRSPLTGSAAPDGPPHRRSSTCWRCSAVTRAWRGCATRPASALRLSSPPPAKLAGMMLI